MLPIADTESTQCFEVRIVFNGSLGYVGKHFSLIVLFQ